MPIQLPEALLTEIVTMRRNPRNFRVTGMVTCSLAPAICKKSAFRLTHPDAANAGSWCPVHGWLFFDSVALPPTERLTTSEIEDRKLEQRRKAEFAQRKALK